MHADVLNFDGSCEPNPGGRMGWGWRIIWADGTRQPGSGARAAHRDNTVNVAEYTALIAGLTAYVQAGGQGPLLVIGDSQLVIRQMTRQWAVKAANLRPLAEQGWAVERQIPGQVTFQWRPRAENTEADALAGGRAVPERPDPRTILADVTTTGLLPQLRATIVRLNATTADPGFTALLQVRLGGRDAYSAWSLTTLRDQAGPAAVAAVDQAFPDVPADQATALRWALRGLALELAIRKVQVQRELNASATRRRT